MEAKNLATTMMSYLLPLLHTLRMYVHYIFSSRVPKEC